MLFVNEIFASIQGEGLCVGIPCVFVRFQGCPVRCAWCDTVGAMAQATANGVGLEDADFIMHRAHASVEPMALWQYIQGRWPNFRHIVLTGGEPCAQDTQALAQFCALVCAATPPWQMHVETSGTGPFDWIPDSAWVTLSPKCGTLPPTPGTVSRANEIKMVVGEQGDVDRLEALLATCSVHGPVSLQPRSLEPAATALCLETVMSRADRGWRLSVQLHKYLDVD